MTEHLSHIPSPEEAEKHSTYKLIDILAGVLDAPGPDGRSLRQLNEDVRAEDVAQRTATQQAETAARAEQERKIAEIESIGEDMINRAMQLLTKIPKKHGNSNTYSFVYREAEDAVFGKNKTVSITKMQGGDYGIIRFGFNPSDKANGNIDVILSKTPQGITFEQRRPYETHWRKIENYQGDRTLDHKFRGEYLLQVLSELSQVSEVLTLAEDFAAETE